MTAWLKVVSYGLPRWGWAIIVLLMVTEAILGRVKNPRWHSVADAIRNLLEMILVPVLGKIPGVGPLVIALLNALAPDDENKPKKAKKELDSGKRWV